MYLTPYPWVHPGDRYYFSKVSNIKLYQFLQFDWLERMSRLTYYG